MKQKSVQEGRCPGTKAKREVKAEWRAYRVMHQRLWLVRDPTDWQLECFCTHKEKRWSIWSIEGEELKLRRLQKSRTLTTLVGEKMSKLHTRALKKKACLYHNFVRRINLHEKPKPPGLSFPEDLESGFQLWLLTWWPEAEKVTQNLFLKWALPHPQYLA